MIKSMSNRTCFKEGLKNVCISFFLIFFLSRRKQGPSPLMGNISKVCLKIMLNALLRQKSERLQKETKTNKTC